MTDGKRQLLDKVVWMYGWYYLVKSVPDSTEPANYMNSSTTQHRMKLAVET
jgi:hypothetical protein